MSKFRQSLKLAIQEWDCIGYYGYGQGRAAATFGEDELSDTVVCHDVCLRSEKCHKKHNAKMDNRFPVVNEIVRRTLHEIKNSDISPVQAIVVAVTVAANRGEPEALRIQEGLKKYGLPVLTDHYMFGQLENLDNGLNKRPPDLTPALILVGADNER